MITKYSDHMCKINTAKCRIMTIDDEETSIDGNLIEKVEDFVFLESVVPLSYQRCQETHKSSFLGIWQTEKQYMDQPRYFKSPEGQDL